jgi:hypothetical protein
MGAMEYKTKDEGLSKDGLARGLLTPREHRGPSDIEDAV